MGIAENIKLLRKKAGLTQKQLAEKSKLSIATIQGYEQGKYEPKQEAIYKLRDALDCNIYEIIDDPFALSGASWNDLEEIPGGIFVQKNLSPDKKNRIKEIIMKPLQNEVYFLNYLLSLGYEYIDTFYDNEDGFDRCLHIQKENIDIPLTEEEYETLKSTIADDVDTQIYKLRKNKGL